jgi:hypothetical protein
MTFGQLRLQLVKQSPGVDADVLDQTINNRLDSIGRHLAWKSLEADGVLSTIAAYQTGTLNVTAGSTALVLTGGTFTNAMTGRRIIIAGENETYTFTYAGATSGTLDRVFEGDSNTAAGFTIFQNLYQLPANYGEPIRGRNERLPVALEYWDRTELDDASPTRGLIIDEPVAWCEASRDASGNRYAELFPAPLDAAGYPYRYRAIVAPLSAASDVIPSWISIRGLTAGVLADLGVAAVMNNGIFEQELSQMRREDSAARGPVHIQMDSMYTRHRMRRAMNSYRRHLP